MRSSGWSSAGAGILPIVGASPVQFLPTASNVVASAPQLVAAAASKTIYIISVVVNNRGNVAHTVDFITSTGAAIIFEVDVAPKSSLTVSFLGEVRTLSGDALKFYIDATGVATDVNVNGWVLQQ